MDIGLVKIGDRLYSNDKSYLVESRDVKLDISVENTTSYSSGSYVYIQTDLYGSSEAHSRKVGDSFTSLVPDYPDGVQVRYSPMPDKWIHGSLQVKAGDVVNIWGTTRHIYKDTSTEGRDYRVKMPLYWRCDSNNIIREIYPDVYHDTAYSAVSAQNYIVTHTKDSPKVVNVLEDGVIYFNAYIADAMAALQATGETSSDTEDVSVEDLVDSIAGITSSGIRTINVLDTGSLKLDKVDGYRDDYTNSEYFYDTSVEYNTRRKLAIEVRKFIQDAITLAGNYSSKLVFPKNKTFVVDVAQSITIPANFELDLNGSTIQAFPHTFNGTDVIKIPWGSPNVTIKNGNIFGDNNRRIVTHNEYNFGVAIHETNCHLKNLKIGYVAGDAIRVNGDGAWNFLKVVYPSSFTRGVINTDSSSSTYEYVPNAGTFTAVNSNSIVTGYLDISYYKNTLPPKKAVKAYLAPRPTLRIPDLQYYVSQTYKCVYYSYDSTNNTYTFISHEGGKRWGDILSPPSNATHFRLVFDLDKSKDGDATVFGTGKDAFKLWISLISPIYGVHIDNCEILYCGRNGINPTGARKIIIDKCLIHDVYGTNNCVGIDFENTSYIDKDCIVRDTKIWRCGSRYQYNPPHSKGSGGSIALAQGAHYVIDNCEFGGIWGGNEDVHISNCICSTIKLSARGGVNVLGVHNTVDNCIVSGDVVVYNTVVSNSSMECGYTDGSVQSTFNSCTMSAGIGPGIYNNCRILKGSSVFVGLLPKTTVNDSYTVLNSCTIDASGLQSHNYKSPIIDLINCTVYKDYRNKESGQFFGGTFRKVIGNTFHLHGKKSASVTNTNPWMFTAATDGLTFTDNRIHYYEDYYDGVTAAYTNGKQKPIYIDFISCQKPSIISDNIVEQIDEDVAPFRAAIGNEDVLFYDNTFDAGFKLTTDITLVSNVYSGKVYRKNTKQVRGYQHEYERNSRIIEVNDSKMPTPIIRCNNNGTVTVNGTGYAFDIDIEEYTYGGSNYVLSDTSTESRTENDGVYSYTLESGAADKKIKFTTSSIPADSVHFAGNEISVEYEVPSKAPSPTLSVSTVDINNKKITVNLPPVTYMADTHTVVFEASADNETWETINDTSYKITKATPAVNHYFRAHTDKGSNYYADSDYVTQTIEF